MATVSGRFPYCLGPRNDLSGPGATESALEVSEHLLRNHPARPDVVALHESLVTPHE
jgi:hypothetical protein